MSIDRENNSLNAKVIYDLTSFTHLDYPNHLSCIVWFSGCNMRCDYCYNKDIVFAKDGKYSYNDILDFLKTRVNLLEAVVLSGGEASSYDLVPFCQKIKQLGFKIKLDTNGTNFLHIKELIDLNLLDYVALDYKAPEAKFTQITHSNKFDEFSKTLDLLINSNVEFEARTTVHADLLSSDDINEIIIDLKNRGYKNSYFIQEFLETEKNIGDLKRAKNKLDKSSLRSDLEVIFR
ncbi:MAG: anaerobic ribonucleoside-triphosphate reductase activating protein [Sulfurimonas sp. RIFCSPLOWO2_12_FULL_36_74]|uniref:anaerobic ribonucleoside-triphosphate reductase activating protein n=1 Tax=Sulfurimonas sp. RIFCSPLOWO2_12_36_12 TaxID=1802253 RepID=UPI0008BF852A|nr:anaerobic ribonucleoside-triphosphate reductase activating protein [Sulfurimonas sp. RIFCSPLOWO2_12_36_12]OHD98900.1 MAG: anaerobic ribonucleoside-triphosphate reductase activating protein [Sulfurimonas sp. RIFCSPLOWO2_02_FULL_36_28]OHE00786.1 MAG: anaerobic ribonucleoside-triphosphate reductase activating protein [Sulfurimonas sp. RIFCSPLOWO2_12_36_12]OHE03543.1 MAG: anaerobic ribonucleoside-triphosphate reductase activating protein [Sulfurimonas sp. RIFCSPLOWO2_12_FULL_36_74]